jgi:hypothetical protein
MMGMGRNFRARRMRSFFRDELRWDKYHTALIVKTSDANHREIAMNMYRFSSALCITPACSKIGRVVLQTPSGQDGLGNHSAQLKLHDSSMHMHVYEVCWDSPQDINLTTLRAHLLFVSFANWTENSKT